MQIVLARVGAAAAMAYGARAAGRALEPTGDECLRAAPGGDPSWLVSYCR